VVSNLQGHLNIIDVINSKIDKTIDIVRLTISTGCGSMTLKKYTMSTTHTLTLCANAGWMRRNLYIITFYMATVILQRICPQHNLKINIKRLADPKYE